MIKLNTPYTIENGDIVTFEEVIKGSITGTYGDGKITGTLDGNLLKSTFHNTKENAAGLMEITFHENGFEAKWKSGLEPGPMRGKWVGKLDQGSKSIFNISIDRDIVVQKMELLVTESVANKKEFCKEMISFVRENQEFLWVLPLYVAELRSIKELIDEDELEGSVEGLLDEDELFDEFSSKVFSKYALFYDSNINEYGYNEGEDLNSFIHFILVDLNLSKEDFLIKLKESSDEATILYNKFLAQIRTTLYATIVRAYYTLNSQEILYTSNDIANIIISPIDDEKFKSSITNTTNIVVGDDLFLAIEDVLYCLQIDIKDEKFAEDWGDYSINFEKIADYIYGQESYNFPLIEL